MTATVQTCRAGASPVAGPGPHPLRLVRPAPRRRRPDEPVIVLSWRVLGPDGRLLGWVQLRYVRATGRVCWQAAAPYGGWVPIPSGGRRRRGRDAVTALLVHHGLQEVR